MRFHTRFKLQGECTEANNIALTCAYCLCEQRRNLYALNFIFNFDSTYISVIGV